jgi:hypothetical protein
MVHLLSQLDPMVWLMMVVVAVGFVVTAAVLVELLPGDGKGAPAVLPSADAPTAEPEPAGLDHDGRQVARD